jgi:prepilin-type N-terminal cleavage/methylation domain-containing protein
MRLLQLKTRKGQRGSSLVEVVVAVAILAIFAAGVLNSFGYGFFITEVMRENQRATQIMLEKLETVRLYSWTQVNTPGFIPASFTEVYDPQSPTSPGITYTGTLSIDAMPGTSTSYGANMRQLTVTLNWVTGGRVPHSRTLTTFIAKDGLQNYVY